MFQIKKTKIVDVVVVIYVVWAKGVGGGEGRLETKGGAVDQSGLGFATMSKTSVFQVSGFFSHLLVQGVRPE